MPCNSSFTKADWSFGILSWKRFNFFYYYLLFYLIFLKFVSLKKIRSANVQYELDGERGVVRL